MTKFEEVHHNTYTFRPIDIISIDIFRYTYDNLVIRRFTSVNS